MIEHERYANELASFLKDGDPEDESLEFALDRTKSRNAAKAMEALLRHRITKRSRLEPTHWETAHMNGMGVFSTAGTLRTEVTCGPI